MDELSDGDKSWHLGRAQGFLWGLAVYSGTINEAATILFPTTITRKVLPNPYMDGVHRGFCIGATLSPPYTRYGSLSDKARLKFEGSYWNLIDKSLELSNLSNIINHNFKDFLIRSGNDVIKSYPATKKETSEVLRRWFLK